jgi:hypothetical protein
MNQFTAFSQMRTTDAYPNLTLSFGSLRLIIIFTAIANTLLSKKIVRIGLLLERLSEWAVVA